MTSKKLCSTTRKGSMTLYTKCINQPNFSQNKNEKTASSYPCFVIFFLSLSNLSQETCRFEKSKASRSSAKHDDAFDPSHNLPRYKEINICQKDPKYH